MPTVVGLTYEKSGAIHFYTPAQIPLSVGDLVMVESASGPQLATVVTGPKEMPPDRVPTALRPVLRIATPDDISRLEANRELEERSRRVVPDKIRLLDLPMKLIDVEALFDGGKIIVYFAADGRIDFRELVKELVAALGVRVQMHQLGARDHAKMLGGIGSCGRMICCCTWMNTFEPVSMKMAKHQSLFLNPAKFSGNCGKLKCCLRYEYDFYSEESDVVPAVGAYYDTPEGRGYVTEICTARNCFFVDVPQVGPVEMRLRLNIEPVGCGQQPEDESQSSPCFACPKAESCRFVHPDSHPNGHD